MSKSKSTIKARIKKGAAVFQDHYFGKWPNVAGGKTADVNTVFEVEDKGKYLDCRAHGYGILGENGGYGNGSIFVDSLDDLKPVK